MCARAISKNIRISPMKLREYADGIRGSNVERAVNWLQAQPVKRTIPIAKTLISAYHNAKQADESITDMAQMTIADIRVDQGPVQRYFKPTAQGRVSPQKRRMSHLSIVVKKVNSKREV